MSDTAAEPVDRAAAGSPARQLRELIAAPGITVVPECYSALTARLAQRAGFGAACMGGNSIAGMFYGLPDHGMITIPEMAHLASMIVEATGIPLIVDIDQGGETSLNVRRTIRVMEHVGVAGVHIEDAKNPKHLLQHTDEGPTTLHKDDLLVSIDEMCLRIDAAVNTRKDDDFVIIARTDEILNRGSLDEAIKRGIAYAEAGADLYMPLLMTPEQVTEIAAAVPIPLLDVNRPVAEYRDTPLAVDLYGGWAPTALALYKKLVTHLREFGDYPGDVEQLPWAEYDDLLDDAKWLADAERWRNRARV